MTPTQKATHTQDERYYIEDRKCKPSNDNVWFDWMKMWTWIFVVLSCVILWAALIYGITKVAHAI